MTKFINTSKGKTIGVFQLEWYAKCFLISVLTEDLVYNAKLI